MTKFPARAILLLALSAIFYPALAQEATRIQGDPSRISGTVVSAASGSPLAGARVSITDVKDRKNQRTLLTGDDGHFSFPHVPPGKYSLVAARRGFLTAAYDQHEAFATAIVTGIGLDTENLTLRLQPSAMLSGKILDEADEPVREANVTLYRQDHRLGINRIQRFEDEATDDQGSYEFSFLPPGTYFVSVKATPWYAVHPPGHDAQNGQVTLVDPSLDVLYPITYYQDSTDPDDALPIPIRGGDHLEVTLHLTPSPALHLRFHVEGNDFSMPSLQQRGLDGTEPVGTYGAQLVSPGEWEMSGIAAGRYSISLPSQDPSNANWSQLDMDFTSDGEEFDTTKAAPNGSVKVQVAMIGGGAPPDTLSLQLVSPEGRFVSGNQMDAKGIVNLPNVPPGQYRFDAVGSKRYSVISVSDHGRKSGNTVTVRTGTATEVTVTIAEGTVNLEGFAQKDGKPMSGVMVVLVPQQPEANRELFRRDQSDLDGSFVLRDIAPGTYTVVAIENGWDLDWSEPAVIAYYLKRGQTVTISPGNKGSQNLPSRVEVQSK